MIRIVLFKILILCFSFYMLNGQQKIKLDGITSVVGSKIILKSDLDKYIKQFTSQFGGDISRCQALKELINQKILVNQAKIDSLKTQESSIKAEVDHRINTWVSQLGSISRLEDFYGYSESKIRQEISEYIREMMLSGMMKRKIVENLTITPLEIKKYLNENRDSIKKVPKQMEISEIVIYPNYSKESKDFIIESLSNIKKDIENGASFKTKAILYSDDKKSSIQGGVYNNVKRRDFDKDFESIVYNLDEGQLSEPFETSKGFYIVKLLKRRGETLDISLIMKKHIVSSDLEEEIIALFEKIKFKIINKEISFEDAVKTYSQGKSKDNKGIVIANPRLGKSLFFLDEMKQKEYELYQEIKDLDEKNISDIIKQTKDDKIIYRMVMVNRIIDEHKISYQNDFDMIKSMALQDKQNKKLEKWLKENKKSTYIDIYEDKLKECL